MASTHSCGGREARGMMISFQPNKRASREKAPGPSRAMAAEMAMIGASASFDSKGLNNCSGNQEKAIPRLSRPARRLSNGVRNPISRPIPLSKRSAVDTNTISVMRSEDSRQRIPCPPRAVPTTTRRSRSPAPGRPAGNAENNLCSCIILRR
jgi:hypothetical protein